MCVKNISVKKRVKNISIKNIRVKNISVKNIRVKNIRVKNIRVKNISVKNIRVKNGSPSFWCSEPFWLPNSLHASAKSLYNSRLDYFEKVFDKEI